MGESVIKIPNKGLADKLPLWHFDGNTLVYADGSLGAGFKLQGNDISCATNQAKNDFTQSIENLLNTLEDGLRLQVFYRLNSDVDGVIDQHKVISEGAGDTYRPVLDSRAEFLAAKAGNGQFFRTEIYLFVRSLPHKYRKQRLWEPEKKFVELSRSQYEGHKEKFDRAVTQLESSLRQSGLFPKSLNKEEWFGLLFEYFNLSRHEEIGLPVLCDDASALSPSIVSQLLLSDLEVHTDHIRMGDYLFRVLTLKTLPDSRTHATMVDSFTKLPFHFWISQNIHILDQKKEVEKLQLQRRLAHSMAAGAKNVSDLESESKLAHIEELISELLEGSEKLLSSDFNVIIWGKNANEIEEKSDSILKAFRYMNQCEGIVETLPGFDAYLGAMPGSGNGLRQKKMKTSNVAHLMALYAPWEGNQNPVCLLPSRDSSLVKLDPFAPELLNWNGLVFGGSGAGKSFTISQLMLMFYGQSPRPKIIWIDNGASSQRLLEVLDGEFIELKIDSKIRLNVFDLEPGQTEPTPAKIKLILAVLETILKDENHRGLPKREKALLEEAIFKTYRDAKGKIPTLGDLRKILANHEVPELKSYAQILYSWTGQTAYGRLLDGETNIKLNKDLVTVEIKGLDTYPDLQNVFLLLFTEFIRSEASRDMTQPYILIIDEAWKLFQTPSGLAFTLEAYRTFRKFRSSILCISQNYADFLASDEIRKALYPNTSFLFILRQQVDNWLDFKDRLSLNDAELEQIKSIQVVKGKYSEFFIRQNDNRTMIRLEPDPLSYWICTSDPGDKAKIEAAAKNHPDLSKMEVLKKLAKEYWSNIHGA